MRKPQRLSVKTQQIGWKHRRSIFYFILLLASLTIAGSVDAAMLNKVSNHSINTSQSQPLLAQMFKNAVSAYSETNFHLAYQRFSVLASHEVADAQYYLATLYDDGRGVEANPAMAVFWYRRAAKLGHVNAQYNIGVAHANGDGVQKNMIDAVRWWRVAAMSGSINAQFNLGIVYLKGKGIRRDPSEAVHWWNKAAQQGDPAAQYNLGALYANGQGVSKNVYTALDWWARAAEQGFEQAIVALRDFHSLK